MGFWDSKRVTVTGGSGFLGSFVVERLNRLGAQVFVPRSRDCDLTQSDHAQLMYRKSRPEILIHMAATVGGIGANQGNPGRFFYNNMAMGLNVVEHGLQYGSLKKLVIIGTTCSYPKFTPVPFLEDDLWNGYPEETNASYGIAKRALLSMALGYRAQYGMTITYLIPANLYGPRDNFDLETSHVIPALIRRFTEAKEMGEPKVVAWGTGDPTREFLYAEDAAEGIVLAAERYEDPDPVNLGTGQEIRIRELVHLIAGLVGYQGEITWDPSRPDGQPRRCLDTSRARTRFGFQATTSLEDGLRQTIRWSMMDRTEAGLCGDAR